MKTYEIEMTEVQRVYYHVLAENEDDAVKRYEEASFYDQTCMLVNSKAVPDEMTGVREI